MKVEVLISTMNRDNDSLYKTMNIKTDAVIINQCLKESYYEIKEDFGIIRIISNCDRGLSKSRNLALESSNADICIIADDDLVYKDNYKEMIIDAYKRYNDADLIAFDVPSSNVERPTSKLKEGRIGFLKSMKISSFQITFKKNSFVKCGISFNELFGAGSVFNCGEENILMKKALDKGLKIYYVNSDLADVHHVESTWYNGFDEKLMNTKGAMFYEMSRTLFPLFILQFGIRKHKLYKESMSFKNSIEFMINGYLNYKKMKKN